VDFYRNSEVVGQVYGDMTTSHEFSSSIMVAVIYMTIGDATYLRFDAKSELTDIYKKITVEMFHVRQKHLISRATD
jgi:hypothetical protein